MKIKVHSNSSLTFGAFGRYGDFALGRLNRTGTSGRMLRVGRWGFIALISVRGWGASAALFNEASAMAFGDIMRDYDARDGRQP